MDFDTCQNLLWRYCRRLTNDEQRADDLLQDVLLATLRRLKREGQRDRILQTLSESLPRLLKKARWMHNSSKRKILELPVENVALISSPELITVHVERQEAAEALRQQIEALPSKLRFALKRCYLEGRSGREVATEIGKSPGAVRKWCFRAIQILRNDRHLNRTI